MKHIKKNILQIFMIVFSSNASAIDLQNVVDDICLCSKPFYDALEKWQGDVQGVVSSDSKSNIDHDLDRMTDRVLEITNKSIACLQGLDEKYPEVRDTQGLNKKAWELANQQCPKPVPKYSR